MRIAITLALLLLSFAGNTQTTTTPAKQAPKWELALSAGIAGDDAGFLPREVGPFRASIGILRNIDRYQIGLAMESGINSANRGYLAPVLVANCRVEVKRGFFYGGIAAGGFAMQQFSWTGRYNDRETWKGYTAGLQLGYVHSLGKRFALTTEAAFRYAAAFHRRPAEEGVTWGGPYYQESRLERWDILSIPVTVGIRYRF